MHVKQLYQNLQDELVLKERLAGLVTVVLLVLRVKEGSQDLGDKQDPQEKQDCLDHLVDYEIMYN